MAEALYRKYRPQVFEDVVGQEHIERTLRNAIEQDKVSHAYLFTGPRGTGKTTTARLLAKSLLCEKGPTAEVDDTCVHCEAIANGNHPDVYELDAASRTGVENVREEIIGRVQFAPTQGRYKVYIIDEVHMLSTAAFNALLKTLEEPPGHVVFILCTTEAQKVPETIHSRCQRFDFRRISVEAIISRLGAICVAEEVEFEGEALELIAHRAEGGMRNALTSLEQLMTFGRGRVNFQDAEHLLGSLDSNDMAEIVSAIGRRDIVSCFIWTANYVETGADLAQFTRDLAVRIRNMYILSLTDGDAVFELNEAVRREMIKELQYFGQDRLTRSLGVLRDLSTELRTSINPRLSFEIALTRLVRPDSDLTLEALAERIEALESAQSATVPVVSPLEAMFPTQKTETQTTSKASEAVSSSDSTIVQQENANPLQVSGDSSAESKAVVSSGDAGRAVLFADFINPAVLQRIWQAALQSIKKEKAAYGVLFLNTKVHFDETKQEFVIEFPAENEFAYTAVQKPEIFAVVAKALEQAAGTTLTFRYAQAAAVDMKSQGTGLQPATQLTSQAASSASKVPDSESTPLDAYEGYVSSYRDDSFAPLSSRSFQQKASSLSSQASPREPEKLHADDMSIDQTDDLDEAALKAMLAQEYGDGIVFDVIEE